MDGWTDGQIASLFVLQSSITAHKKGFNHRWELNIRYVCMSWNVTQICKSCGVTKVPITVRRNGRERPKETERESERDAHTVESQPCSHDEQHNRNISLRLWQSLGTAASLSSNDTGHNYSGFELCISVVVLKLLRLELFRKVKMLNHRYFFCLLSEYNAYK